MSTLESQHIPIQITPGVCPPTDSTEADTPHFTAADKIRFIKGRPQKLGGWIKQLLTGTTISGCARSIFSGIIDGKLITIIGSSTALYALIGSNLQNITPLEAAATTIANSLDTHYDTLVNNPITTALSSNVVLIADPEAALFIPGDAYKIAGATGPIGGIDASELNTTHIVRDVAPGVITIKTVSIASGAATGGGNAVVRSSGLVTVNATAHDQENGQRVAIADAVTFGGILDTQVNGQFQIRNVLTDSFDIMTEGFATSSVSAGGGASTAFQVEIGDGLCNETGGQGYGMGFYGVGLYGTAHESANNRRFPRIWFTSQFGQNFLTTPGNGGGLYRWDGSLNDAPILVPGAPTDINYAFVSDNIVVTFGAGGDGNHILASDQNDAEEWSSSSTNQVYDDYIEGAGRFWSHVSLNGTNLIFTPDQTYTFRYIGLPFVWEVKFKDNIGIIAPMARVVVNGVAYWMGQNNFYMWRGGNVEIVPSNSGAETTLLNYIFKNLNRGQASKCFAWYNKRFDEIWFHYPSAGSDEVDRVARYHVTDKHWTPDTFDRLAAEYPNTNLGFPRLIDSDGNFFRHEVGNNDDTAPMPFMLRSNKRDMGTDNVLQTSIIPDSVQNDNITFVVNSFSYPQSAQAKNTKSVPVTPETEYISLDIDGRFLQYEFSGEALDQEWIMGRWLEPVQLSSRSE